MSTIFEVPCPDCGRPMVVEATGNLAVSDLPATATAPGWDTCSRSRSRHEPVRAAHRRAGRSVRDRVHS